MTTYFSQSQRDSNYCWETWGKSLFSMTTEPGKMQTGAATANQGRTTGKNLPENITQTAVSKLSDTEEKTSFANYG